MRRIVLAMVACLLLVSPIAIADERVAIYSNVCWHAEAGDLLGDRIGVLRLSDSPYVFVQSASGEWETPFLAKASADDLKRGKLNFVITDGPKSIHFHGTISEKSVTGQFDGWRDDKGKPLVVRLVRSMASKKRVPNC